jgi:hypothetical protein
LGNLESSSRRSPPRRRASVRTTALRQVDESLPSFGRMDDSSAMNVRGRFAVDPVKTPFFAPEN